MLRTASTLFLFIGITLSSANGQEAAPALDANRLITMVHERDHLLIEQIFRRHPGAVLPFIDRFLEEGLAHKERGEANADAEAWSSYEQGLTFARIASRAFGDDVFERYAASFTSWDSAERARFRRGQAAFREGGAHERAERFEEAKRSFLRAALIAEQLQDTWGSAMALAGVARTELRLGRTEETVRAARQASDLYRRLRLSRSEAESMLIAADALKAAEMTRPSLTNSSRAWAILADAPHDALRQRAFDTYVRGLEASGQADEAQRVRDQERERAETRAAIERPN